jgi:hypothetical protein
MKLAATIIDGVCVDNGSDMVDQKNALRVLLAKHGGGSNVAHVLYSSQRPARRKRIDLSGVGDVQKAYDSAKKAAINKTADQGKLLKAEAEKREELRLVKVADHKKRREAMDPKKRNAKKQAKAQTK